MLIKMTIRSIIVMVFLSAVWMVGTGDQALAETSGDYEYTDNGDGTATITKYIGPAVDVEIPETLEGLKVVEIGDWAFSYLAVDPYEVYITGVTIPSTVTRIGDQAFYKQNDLSHAVIPDSVTDIGEGAFNGTALTSVDLPDNLTLIANNAFSFNNLTSLTIPESVTSIGDSAFYGNQLTEVIIPVNVTEIKGMAFGGNELTSATFLRSNTEFLLVGFPGTTDPFADNFIVGSSPQDVTIYGYDSSTAQDLANEFEYTFKAISDLSGLTLSSGSLEPGFDSVTTSYTADVAYNVSSITATPTAVDSLAGITVNGDVVASGNASESISLNYGNNTIMVIVTAQDSSSKPYTVVVTRASAPKAITALDFTTPAAVGVVNESDQTVAITVPYGTDITSLTPTIVHTGASVSPNSGVAQDFTSPVTYTVTAADSTTQAYVVTVTVAAKPAPAIPQHLTADRGDRQVNLNWDTVTGATYYNVYLSTIQGQFIEPAAATVTESTYNVTGLSNGVTYYFIVKAGHSEGLGAASNEVEATPATVSTAPTAGGGNSRENDKDDGETAAPLADILVNDQLIESGALTTTSQDQTMLTIAADRTQLDDRLAAEQQGAIITYRANGSYDKIVAELDGQWVKNMIEQQAVILLKTDQATYELPARQMNIDALASQFGESVELEDIKLRIEIDIRVAEETVNTIEEAASKDTLTLLAPPIAFLVQATYEDITLEISKFDTYIERWILIPDAVDQNGVATSVVMESDSTVRSVPTQVVVMDGQYYARVNSLENGTYTIVSHPDTEFSDVDHHWAEQEIQDMVMRMIIMVMGDGTFEPNRDITRVEFASILARGLGLPIESGTAPFSDISPMNWYHNIVNTTYAYRFIYGFEDGTFRPNDLITREEAMVIIARTMELIGLDEKLSSRTVDETLLPYTDATSISDWARDGVADSIEIGVVQGRSSSMLAPLDFLTRAEAAMIVQRLLQLSSLI